MKVANWEQAEKHLVDSRPELYGARITGVWERFGGSGGSSYSFAVRTDGHVLLMWVGPRGGISTALRYTKEDWSLLVGALS